MAPSPWLCCRRRIRSISRHIRRATGVQTAELASEREFKQHFPDCETGAMPPFGNLYGIPVYVDESLAEDREIAFNAGSHFELIKMAYRDFDTAGEAGGDGVRVGPGCARDGMSRA